MKEEAHEEIYGDILSILQETLTALKKGDYTALKEISNHTIHNASIFQDQDSLSIAVLIYAVHKIMVSEHKSQIMPNLVTSLEQAQHALEQQNMAEYRIIIRNLFKLVAETDEHLHLYIRVVIDQAQIKKGSKLFEHGISLARAAELLGISRWELMQYIGKTRLPEQIPSNMDVRDRVKYARKIFRL